MRGGADAPSFFVSVTEVRNKERGKTFSRNGVSSAQGELPH